MEEFGSWFKFQIFRLCRNNLIPLLICRHEVNQLHSWEAGRDRMFRPYSAALFLTFVMFGSFVGLGAEREDQEEQQRHWEQTFHPTETKTKTEGLQWGSSADESSSCCKHQHWVWHVHKCALTEGGAPCDSVHITVHMEGLLTRLSWLQHKGGQIHKTVSQGSTKPVYLLRKCFIKRAKLLRAE